MWIQKRDLRIYWKWERLICRRIMEKNIWNFIRFGKRVLISFSVGISEIHLASHKALSPQKVHKQRKNESSSHLFPSSNGQRSTCSRKIRVSGRIHPSTRRERERESNIIQTPMVNRFVFNRRHFLPIEILTCVALSSSPMNHHGSKLFLGNEVGETVGKSVVKWFRQNPVPGSSWRFPNVTAEVLTIRLRRPLGRASWSIVTSQPREGP